MCLGIGHKEGTTVVVDALREWVPPFNPEAVVAEAANLLRNYRCSVVHGDRYGGEWVRAAFRAQGVHYEPADRSASQLYLDLLPAINARSVALLDHPRAVDQLCSLERRAGRSAKDVVDHPRGAHDDAANVIAGCVAYASKAGGRAEQDRREVVVEGVGNGHYDALRF